MAGAGRNDVENDYDGKAIYKDTTPQPTADAQTKETDASIRINYHEQKQL